MSRPTAIRQMAKGASESAFKSARNPLLAIVANIQIQQVVARYLLR